MKFSCYLLCCLMMVFFGSFRIHAETGEFNDTLYNPFTVAYLQNNLKKAHPRLILTPESEKDLRKKIQHDPLIRNYYQAIQNNAGEIMNKPLLERNVVGRRLLGTSREMLYRMNVLSMVYRMEQDPGVLNRINEELRAVCGFVDWNPAHFLDVAEMCMAVAIALDWTAGDLPEETIALAKAALIEKGIKPSYHNEECGGLIVGNSNWNQVCNGGLIAASIMVAEEAPELAARTIHRSLDVIPVALNECRPDGVYPEGPSYWSYGTGYTVLTISMLESAFSNDFGIAGYPGFMESALVKKLCEAPSGMYYNYADCRDYPGEDGDLTLAWFAAKTGKNIFINKNRFTRAPETMNHLSRLAGAGIVWLSQYEDTGTKETLPVVYRGRSSNPLVIFRAEPGNKISYYFAGKGGKATLQHGNMDAGSFIFELYGIRWVVDPGNQAYHALEKTGFDLWGKCQECDRWKLLTKNNFGHSTLTVNNQLFAAGGMAELVSFEGGETPEASFDLTPVYGDLLTSARRSFKKDSPGSIVIADEIEPSGQTGMIAWQLMTTAGVTLTAGGAILEKEGKQVKVDIRSPQGVEFSVIRLDPPPLELDKRMPNLKRLELRVPAYLLGERGTIEIRLAGMKHSTYW